MVKKTLEEKLREAFKKDNEYNAKIQILEKEKEVTKETLKRIDKELHTLNPMRSLARTATQKVYDEFYDSLVEEAAVNKNHSTWVNI